jgi:sporulation protein YlmC with PRC-barrel domain
MLQLSANFSDKYVLSLRTGSSVAKVLSPIFNPDNLKIEGFVCEDRFSKSKLILLCQDIRDSAPKGYFVNDHEVLCEPGELIRLKKIMDIAFDPINKQVVTVSKVKVGKVVDYAYDTGSMYVHKLYVSQSLLKSFTGGSLSVDRNQIQEITPRRIVINDLEKKAKLKVSTAPNAA